MPVTREQLLAYKRRYDLVNRMEREELRRTPVALKFRQLSSLMASVATFGWDAELADGEEETWHRWQRLRDAVGE